MDMIKVLETCSDIRAGKIVFEQATDEMLNDRLICSCFLATDGMLLERMSEKMKASWFVVAEALENNHRALRFVSNDLLSHVWFAKYVYEVVSFADREHDEFFVHFSPIVLNNLDFLKELNEKDFSYVYKHCLDDILKNAIKKKVGNRKITKRQAIKELYAEAVCSES